MNSLPIFTVASLPRTAISGVLSSMNFMNQAIYEHSDCVDIAISITHSYYRLVALELYRIFLSQFESPNAM